MALPDYFKIEQGTPIVLGEAGATGVTHTLSLNNLADGSAVMSAVIDFGAQWDDEYAVITAIETGTAPTAGNRVDVYCPCTHSTSYYPAGTTGSAGAWPTDGNEDEWALQAGAPIQSLIATNDGNTLQIQAAGWFRPGARYGVVIADNNLGQATRNVSPATNNLSRIILIPRRLLIQDAA